MVRYLDFDLPLFARQVARRASAESLHQVPHLALGLQLRDLQARSTV